jgi:uncharacterized protein (TIGR03032 family)
MTEEKKEIQHEETVQVKSSHSDNFSEVLQKIEGSILVSTYQANKVFLLRNMDGYVNAHFRDWKKPMGMAVSPSANRIAIGGLKDLSFLNLINSEDQETNFFTQKINITGSIDIHEMEFGNDGLWFINTRFSCLCKMDDEHNFVPVWRPKWVSELAAEDRCHLNGLALENGVPRFVTAISGVSDKKEGWRENKRDSGVLVDLMNNEVVVDGLCMPHSPRIYRGDLWILDSGKGELSKIVKGKVVPVTRFQGFPRGICFYKNLAFVGISKVRETIHFGELPITESIEERTCGVFVVDINTGEIVSWIKFEAGVEEIFSVCYLPYTKPDILPIHDDKYFNSFYLSEELWPESKAFGAKKKALPTVGSIGLDF